MKQVWSDFALNLEITSIAIEAHFFKGNPYIPTEIGTRPIVLKLFESAITKVL